LANDIPVLSSVEAAHDERTAKFKTEKRLVMNP
jgi:hypothetical protein